MGKSGGGMVDSAVRARMLADALERGDLRTVRIVDTKAKKNGTIKVGLRERELPDFTQVVNKGATWLDKTQPGWYRAINTDNLSLDDENSCVLGQAWSLYKNAEDRVFTGKADIDSSRSNFKSFLLKAGIGRQDSAQYGFSFPDYVYAWMNIEAARRSTEKTGHELWDGDAPEGFLLPHTIAWRLDALCWEHLTTTWLVLIKARQDHDKVLLERARAKAQMMSVDELAQLLVDTNKVD